MKVIACEHGIAPAEVHAELSGVDTLYITAIDTEEELAEEHLAVSLMMTFHSDPEDWPKIYLPGGTGS